MTEFGSSVESLKVIVSLVMSLAIANSFIVFVGSSCGIPTIGDSFSMPDPHTLILFSLCILTNIRFLHGNYRHLDQLVKARYNDQSENSPTVRDENYPPILYEVFPLTYILTLLQALLFVMLSFFIYDPLSFFVVVTIVLIADLVMFGVPTTRWLINLEGNVTVEHLRSHFAYQLSWISINLISLVILILAIGSIISGNFLPGFALGSVALFVSLVADYWINRRRLYFPTA
jgi:hypothetical protein